MEQMQEQAQKFYIGENVDIKDSVQKWVNAEIQEVQQNRVYVHYTGWSAKYDTFILLNSNRILKQWQPGKTIKINNRIDAYHPVGGWLEARVIEIQNQNESEAIHKIKVHFFNYHKKYDIWVNLKDKNQVAVIGQKSNAHGIGNRKRKTKNNSKSLSQACRQLFREKLRKMISELREKQLVIKDVQGDGNCLFRSISDQLYGVQTYHMQIRQLCMKYILHQKDFFQDYIIEDVEQYVYRKSQNGQWGDDLEIQAISQIYSRPIQIYAMGSKPIRTFHEDNQNNIQPLKIAYIGSCHYSSIKQKNQLNEGLIRQNFGEFQELFQTSYQSQKYSQQWRARNRDKFAHSAPLQQTIQQRIEAQNRDQKKQINYNQEQVMKAIEESQKQAILKQIQSAELRQLKQKSERQQMQQQLRKIQERQLEQAKKLSKKNQQKWQNPIKMKPYWFDNLLCLGYSESQIWFAIDVKGYDPDAVQNFLLDNMGF